MNKVELGFSSEKGRRSTNQDCAFTYSNPGGLYAIAVADGMGGTNGGEIASALTCKAVKETIESFSHTKEPDLKPILWEVYNKAQKLISIKKVEEPEIATLGTTLVCLVIADSRFAWGNIGDSRLYILKDGLVELLSKDHTLINQTLDRMGEVSSDEIATQSHILTKSIDGGGDLPDIFPDDDDYAVLDGGELFLACSDGALHEKQNPDHSWLVGIANDSGSLKEFLDKIIGYAYSMGSSDNITVAAISNGYVFRNQNNSKSGIQAINTDEENQSGNRIKAKNKLIRFSLVFTAIILVASLLLVVNQQMNFFKFFNGNKTKSNTQKPDAGLAGPDDNGNSPTDKMGSIRGNSRYFEHVDKGNEFLRKKLYIKALSEYEQAKGIEPGDPDLSARIEQIKERLQIEPALKAMEKSETLVNDSSKHKKPPAKNQVKPHEPGKKHQTKETAPEQIPSKPPELTPEKGDSSKPSNPILEERIL